MFDQVVQELEAMGIPYVEEVDGSVVMDISAADKTDVVTIISYLNDNFIEFTIDANSITALVGGTEEPSDVPAQDEATPDPMDEALKGMY